MGLDLAIDLILATVLDLVIDLDPVLDLGDLNQVKVGRVVQQVLGVQIAMAVVLD